MEQFGNEQVNKSGSPSERGLNQWFGCWIKKKGKLDCEEEVKRGSVSTETGTKKGGRPFGIVGDPKVQKEIRKRGAQL